MAYQAPANSEAQTQASYETAHQGVDSAPRLLPLDYGPRGGRAASQEAGVAVTNFATGRDLDLKVAQGLHREASQDRDLEDEQDLVRKDEQGLRREAMQDLIPEDVRDLHQEAT